jgi:cytochrome c6
MVLSRTHVVPALALAALMAVPASLSAETAEATFKQMCAVCHGPDGSGATAMGRTFKLKDLKSAAVQEMTDAQLTEIITNGKQRMPAYKTKLTAAQIKGLVAYLRELAKAKK